MGQGKNTENEGRLSREELSYSKMTKNLVFQNSGFKSREREREIRAITRTFFEGSIPVEKRSKERKSNKDICHGHNPFFSSHSGVLLNPTLGPWETRSAFLSGWAQNENCHLMTGNADQSFFKRELATVSSRASEQRRTFWSESIQSIFVSGSKTRRRFFRQREF